MTSYFIPLHYFGGGHEKVDVARTSSANASSDDLCQFLANPAALIVPNRKGSNVISHREKLGNAYEMDDKGDDDTSASIHLISSKGISMENAVKFPETVNSALSFEFCSIASRSKVLAAYSSVTKECSFYYLNVLSDYSIGGSGPPIVFKFDSKKNIQCSAFSLSDVAVRMCPGYATEKEKCDEKQKEKNKEKDKRISSIPNIDNLFQIGRGSFAVSNSKKNTATFHTTDPLKFKENEIERSGDIIIGKNVLLLLGDTEGKIHFCVVEKSCVLQTGYFQAHSSPVVAVITSGTRGMFFLCVYCAYYYFLCNRQFRRFI